MLPEVARQEQLHDFDPIQAPAVRGGGITQVLAGLGERDVQYPLAQTGSLQSELQGEGSLPGSGHALDQVHVAAGESAAENFVQSRDSSLSNTSFSHRIRRGTHG